MLLFKGPTLERCSLTTAPAVWMNPSGPDQETGYRATGIAVDGQTLYLVAPQVGIVSHVFTPEGACSAL